MTYEDWALVVGIADYPSYGARVNMAHNLKGPVNDAEAIYEFLKDAYNIKQITRLTSKNRDSLNWSDSPRPIRSDIEQWFKNLRFKSEQNLQNGHGPQVGRRVYIYLSGHGIAPRKHDRALVTADAFSTGFVDHMLATSWQEALSNSGYFTEYVLWMDCCTQSRASLIPSQPPLDIKNPLKPQPPLVLMCAAKYPMQAAELPIGEGMKYHGVFTFELLKGLKGAAVNNSGTIRTKDLTAYLYRSMPLHIRALDPQDRKDFSEEPDALEESDLDFTPHAGTMYFDALQSRNKVRKIVFVNSSPADGAQVVISDHAASRVGTEVVSGGFITHSLPPGLYKLSWPGGKTAIDVADEDIIHV
jgi:hypothetical protein